MSDSSFKVSIIGVGNVGAETAFALILSGLVSDLALIDIDHDRVEGLTMDMEHSLSFTPNVKLEGGSDLSLCKDSDLIIVTAGRKQKEGETRTDLVAANKKIFEGIILQAVNFASNAIFLIVSNPVDVLTFEALKLSKLPASKVFGSGTMLDTARFQFHISERVGISPQSIDAYILGEHGDSSFPALSSANINGAPLLDFDGFNAASASECYELTKTAAYRIIHDIGFTAYSIATVTREIVRAMKEDSNKVLMLSTLVNDYYGVSDVCLSVPCVLGRNGIVETIKVPLDENEQVQLHKSAEKIKQYL